jgi:hypothetical protein
VARRTRSRSSPSRPRTGRDDDRELPSAPEPASGADDVTDEVVGHAGELDDEPAGTASMVVDGDDDGGTVAVRSGLDVSLGQVVLAEIGGRWREARVNSRDHSSVLVEYQLDDTPLGARVRRVGVDRIRTPLIDGE